ncbi:tyrosine-type recombinase/integrase [Alteromonas macleodii]|uniref:tyrosine-type recombinase/integrase n=1 Tax=Alteromonas macleodii TaxID=28108 RepID=UPI00193091A9|nr:tyrosine-type recombinase/integrase [Alteromonas macleodii]|tara:strand:+ start:147 stop:1493 length:1347 start_codon:yes stop_codon:yes gene_type:complete
METKNLKKSPTGVWLYRRRVPKALAHLYQGKDICFSLETKSLTQAEIKRDSINADINLKIQEVKSGRPAKARFNAAFTDLRQEYERMERIAKANGTENMFTYAADPENNAFKGDKAHEEAYKAVLTGNVPDEYKISISELFDDWLKANKDKKPQKYISTVSTAKTKLIDYLEADDYPGNISPGIAQMFIDTLLNEGRSQATVVHYKSKIAEVWRWGLAREKFDGSNVWKDAKVEPSLTKSEPEHFRILTNDEGKALLDQTTLKALKTDTYPYAYATYYLMRLLPFLGCRLSELALAKREQVLKKDGRYLIEIRKGKTGNAKRVLPVSPIIEPLLEDALKRSEGDIQLFPEVRNETHVNSISSRISKITGTFSKVEGYKASIHSLRKNFSTALEEIGCPEHLAAILAGHKRLSLTYDLYSQYKHTGELWPYIEKVHKAKVLEPWVKRNC